MRRGRVQLGAILATVSPFLLTATPASALIVWQGDARIEAATPNCSGASAERRRIAVGSVVRTILRPKNLDNNGPDTRVSFLHDSQANFVLFLPGGAMPRGTAAGWGSGHDAIIVANRGVLYRAVRQTPAAPDLATVFIELSGEIDDFMFIPGCTVRFSASYTPRY